MNMKYMKTNYICMKKIKILYTLYMLPGGLQIGGSYSFSQLLKKSKKTKKKKKMRKPRHKKTKHAYKKGMLIPFEYLLSRLNYKNINLRNYN